jgi:dihydrofolate synthase/folylpolyglutamate synthase
VREGLATVSWRGRFELLANDPPIIFDGAHNAQGIVAAVDGIRHYFGGRKVYVMTGVLQDKDYHAIARTLATVAGRAFVLTPDNPRALAGEEYARLLEDCGVPSIAYPSIKAAYAAAVSAARADNTPLICLGSLYTYASL